jgi:trk system potassium uptake protein TrkH
MPPLPPLPPANLTGWLFPAYVALIFAGYAMLLTPGAMTVGQEMGYTKALFSAVNAATLTGFPQTNDISTYPMLGQFIIFCLIVGGSLLSLIIGSTAVSRILRLNFSDARCAVAAVVAELTAVTIGTILLAFDPNRTMPQAAFLAASAFGNAGLQMGNAPIATSWQTHLILLPLITLGGLGLCVLMELYDCLWLGIRPLSTHAKAALRWTALAYVGGTLLLVFLGLWAGTSWTDGAATSGQALRDLVTTSATAAVASRTAGLGLVDLEHINRPGLWVVLLMMVVGGCAASTAGGVKLTTLAALFRGVRQTRENQRPNPSFGYAVAWMGIYLMIVLVPQLLLLHRLMQMPADQVLFNVISAASNVGLTREALNPDPGTAFVLSATMLAGRFGSLMMLWWMADTAREGEIAVG